MTQVTQRIDIQKITKLPVKEIILPSRATNSIFINTPHKGDVEVKYDDKHYPFLFGSVTKTQRDTGSIIKDILKLEEEAKEFLLEQWLKV